MSLDLVQALAKLQEKTAHIMNRHSEGSIQAIKAINLLSSLSHEEIMQKAQSGKFTWMAAEIHTSLAGKYTKPAKPNNYKVMAVDGSQIDVSRHAPLMYHLINIGKVILTYGESSSAVLESKPEIAVSENELYIEDQDSTRSVPIEGAVLGIKRSLRELETLSETIATDADEIPTLALLDGTLIFWTITANSLPTSVTDYLINTYLIPSLDRIKEKSIKSLTSLASYISSPKSTDVVNTLRLAICPYSPINCDLHCGTLNAGTRPCDSVNRITDQDIFSIFLDTGQRSEIFFSTSQVIQKYYLGHEIGFFYLNTGKEIARIEIPIWVASDHALVDLTHSLILDQVDKGLGYPISLSEAHEQAVVTPQNRNAFNAIIETMLTNQDVSIGGSQKSSSKQVRWI